MIAPVPRIAIQAFCETPDVAAAIEAAAATGACSKAHVKVQMGGAPAAVEAYRTRRRRTSSCIEADRDGRDSCSSASTRSPSVCDAGTKVVVIGHVNDVVLYRELMRRGVSEYLIAPVAHARLHPGDLGAVLGARAPSRSAAPSRWSAPRAASAPRPSRTTSPGRSPASLGASTRSIADLDLAFGTAGLDFNQDPPQGIAEAVFAPDRLDARLVDRLLSKCSDNLSLLAAPGDARPHLRPRRRPRFDGADRHLARHACPASSSTCRTSGRPGRGAC